MKRKRNASEPQVKLNNKDNNDNKENKKNNKEYKEISVKVIEYFNEVTGKKCKPIDGNLSKIIPRLKEGYTFDDCVKVIDNKNKDPWFTKHPHLMNIETLFRPSRFDSYLNEIPKTTGTSEPKPLTEEQKYKKRKERIEDYEKEGLDDSKDCMILKRLNKEYKESR